MGVSAAYFLACLLFPDVSDDNVYYAVMVTVRHPGPEYHIIALFALGGALLVDCIWFVTGRFAYFGVGETANARDRNAHLLQARSAL